MKRGEDSRHDVYLLTAMLAEIMSDNGHSGEEINPMAQTIATQYGIDAPGKSELDELRKSFDDLLDDKDKE